MKTLFIVRHAKSSWKYPELDDFERPLNKRGKKDVPVMGRFLKAKNINPDLIISSPAVRAASTARVLAEILSYPLSRIIFDNQIYEADSESLFNIVSGLNENVKNVILIGHNPSLTSFANTIADHFVGNIPTCGIFCTELDISSWSEISEKCGTLKFFEFPKNISK